MCDSPPRAAEPHPLPLSSSAARRSRRGLRSSARYAAIAILTVLLLGCSRPEPRAGASLVLVTIDTLRADALGCYGNLDARTPNLDRFAREGVLFEQAGCPAPITLPSHASLLTGRHPPSHGIRNNGPYRLDGSNWVLAERLSEAGYANAAFVSADPLHSRHGLERGYDLYDCELPQRPGGQHSFPERRGNLTTGPALYWIRETAKAPFHLWVHYFDPHAPYRSPEPFAELAGGDYAGEVSYVDYCLGALLGALSEGGLDASTGVIVTADHGEGLGDHGEPSHATLVFETTMRVPLLVRWPGTPGGMAIRTPVETIDIAPTALGMLRLDPDADLPGRDLAPWIRGDVTTPPPPTPTYAESAYGFLEYGWSPLRTVRNGRWKLVHTGSRSLLFDLEEDPGETRDLAADRPDRVESLERDLADLRERFLPDPNPGIAHGARLVELGYAEGAGALLRVPDFDDPAAATLPSPMDRLEVMDGIQAAREESSRGWPAGAAEQLRRLESLDPGNPQIPFLLGVELRKIARKGGPAKTKNLALAEAALERSVSIRPRFTKARNLQSAVRMQLGLEDTRALESAKTLLDETVTLGVDDADTHYFLYLLHSDPATPLHDPENAEKARRKCLEIDPNHLLSRRAQ